MSRISPQTPIQKASAVSLFADGMTGRFEAALYFPQDFVQYLLGADRQWGERRSFFRNVGMNYASWWDPLNRMAHVGNGLVLGTANFFTGGALYTDLECLREFLVWQNVPYANSFLRTMTSYMKPPARTAFEMGEWTFDSVFVLSASKLAMEYHAWSAPITRRTVLINNMVESHRQALLAWAAALGDGDLNAALPALMHKAIVTPELASPHLVTQLVDGNRAMVVLDMMSARTPSAAMWLQNASRAPLLARRLIEAHVDLGAALRLRLLILARHNPDAVIASIVDAILQRYSIPAGAEGAGTVIEHAAAPHLDVLRQLAVQPSLRPRVLNAYDTIVRNSPSVPIATAAAEGIADLMPASEALALKILAEGNPMAVYAVARALAAAPQKISPAVAAHLRQIPLLEYLVIMGRERIPYPAVRLLQAAMMAENPQALPAMRMMLETAHPFSYQVVMVLRRLRTGLPARAEEISAVLRTLDTGVIENDVIFNLSSGDYILAADNALVLMELFKEGNAGALQAIVRLSEHPSAEVSALASERLVDLMIAKAIPAEEAAVLVGRPHPRIRPMVEYWSVRDPRSLPDALQAYCGMVLDDAALRPDEFPTAVLHVLQAQARVGNRHVGRAISRVFEKSGGHRHELFRLLQQYPPARATVDWGLIAGVAETMVEDLNLSFQVVKLLTKEVPATSGILQKFNHQWFLGAANAGSVEGVAGLEILALHGNHLAYSALQKLAGRQVTPREFFTPPHLARQVLARMSDALIPTGPVQRTPTIMLQVTRLDLQHGRAAALAEGVLKGSRPAVSSTTLEVLAQGVELGAPGALDALYRIARDGGALAAEAREHLLRLGNKPGATHRHTIGVMTRVLAARNEAPVAALGKAGNGAVSQSLRYLETLVTVSDKYAAMAMDELVRQVRLAPDAALPVVRRLLESRNARVVDFVAQRVVAEVADGGMPVDFIREILEQNEAAAGRAPLLHRLRFALETDPRTTPLEPLRRYVQ